MLKILAFTFFCFISLNTFAQSQSDIPIQNSSTDSDVVYRLFSTSNMYNFIKLNTRTGQLWQVQWGLEYQYRFQTSLSNVSRVSEEQEKNGRFFLYPTSNIYNFIMIDQIDGRAWQVQWSLDESDRAVMRIY